MTTDPKTIVRNLWEHVQPRSDTIELHGRAQFCGTARNKLVFYSVWFHRDVVEKSRPDWVLTNPVPTWGLVGTASTKEDAEKVRADQCTAWRLPYRKSQWAITEDTVSLTRVAL